MFLLWLLLGGFLAQDSLLNELLAINIFDLLLFTLVQLVFYVVL
jgi:hypothetical protein